MAVCMEVSSLRGDESVAGASGACMCTRPCMCMPRCSCLGVPTCHPRVLCLASSCCLPPRASVCRLCRLVSPLWSYSKSQGYTAGQFICLSVDHADLRQEMPCTAIGHMLTQRHRHPHTVNFVVAHASSHAVDVGHALRLEQLSLWCIASAARYTPAGVRI